MFSRATGRISRQVPRVVYSWRASSTQTPRPTILKSNVLRAAVIGVAVGVPVGIIAKGYSTATVQKSLGSSNFTFAEAEWKDRIVKNFTLEDVGNWLRQEESTQLGSPGSGVKSWSSVRCASNALCEDNYVSVQRSILGGKNKPWSFWGVFDGHNGWAMSATLKEVLVPQVSRYLSQLYGKTSSPSNEEVEISIMQSFTDLDDAIMADGVKALSDASSFSETLSRLALGYAGSCALLSIFDPSTKLLRTASVGDSRAVLGSRDSSGNYIATPLSADQTGFNELEIARIAKEHPGEEKVIDPKTGRVLGIMISRAFGDSIWKLPKEVIIECKRRYFWKPPRPNYLTPPYLTAEPVITTTQVQGNGEFLILASDGFWDSISSKQAVKLVEMWLIAKNEGTIGKESSRAKDQNSSTERLLHLHEGFNIKDQDFVVEDDNVATHLVRNAFGGANTERLCAIAGAQSPVSRSIRDDITIQVIFFDDTK